MPIFGAVIAGGVALAGDMIASSGQSATNDTNMQINQMQQAGAMDRQLQSQGFNAQQADIARQFSAQQVAQQEQFQMSTQRQAEDWNANMSDTAMQRRVADLKAAGLNPLLAVSQGGASAPVVSGLQGNVASAAQASGSPSGTPGAIASQNAASSFGNLGGQIGSALEAARTGANIDLLKAQTDKLNAESGQEIPAQVAYMKSTTGLNDRNAEQAYYNTMLIQEKIYGQRLDNDQLRDVLTPMQGQRLEVLKATRDALISAQQSDSAAKQLGLQKLRNLNDIESSNLGKSLNWLNAILEPANSAAKLGATIGAIP